MKRNILLLLGMFMMVSTVEANHGKKSSNRIGFNYSYENSVIFEERGVEFFIFTNGEFDFNTHYNDTYYNGNRGVRIDRDYRGRIRKVGHAYINYDRNGNVTRIGNVFMRYYRGRLIKVGHLRVSYNLCGIPVFHGNVKNNYYSYNGVRFNLNIGDIFDYNHSYFTHRDFNRNYKRIREDNNYYYYKANKNAKVGKRSEILRRRKPASTNTKRKYKLDTRRNNTTYRKSSSVTSKRNSTVDRNKKTYRKPTSVNSRRNVTKDKKNSNNSYRKSNTTRKQVEKSTRNKTEKRNNSERKRRS